MNVIKADGLHKTELFYENKLVGYNMSNDTFESLISELKELSVNLPQILNIVGRLEKERKKSDEFHSRSIMYDTDW